MGHHFLAPSAAHIWGKPGGCRYAPTLQAMNPEREESEAAREGTAAHEPASEAAMLSLRAQPMPDRVGQAASNGVLITREMQEGAELYAEDVRGEAIKRGVFGSDSVKAEQRVMSPRIHPLNGGTPDLWLHDARGRELIVWDYKFGFRIVDAFENWQLMNYAALILDELGIDGATEQQYTVTLKVVQPRAYRRGGPVDSWTVRATDLRPYFNDLAQGAAETVKDDPPARPGTHCLDCSGRHACEALRRAAASAMQYSQSPASDNLPGPALGLELELLRTARDLIEARRNGLEQEAAARIARDEVVPGWTVGPRYGRTAWKDPQQAIGIGTAYGVDLRKNEPITPAQAKKAGLPDDVVQNFTYRPAGGVKLQPVKSNDVKKVFTK